MTHGACTAKFKKSATFMLMRPKTIL